ncbi:hypothetical protein F7725_009526 [Dissostichus mawsoni]|uniref:Uncharacterized protein n=1 Tax=Dissostichus mawsoni TaxID=36200 RepID=A0A7J5XNV7_DISMA|nr:hypothetical protein F7725_009526 [Dissostichus mawsoni]
MSAEPEKEQEMAHKVEYLPEGEDSYIEDSYVEDSYVEDLPMENAAPSPAPSNPSSEELQAHRRQCRRPKVFTYDRLGSPACYNIKAPPLHTNLKVPWTHTVPPYHFQQYYGYEGSDIAHH